MGLASTDTDCQKVVDTLEALPGSVICSKGSYPADDSTTIDAQTLSYSLTFTGNPGYLKPIVIDKYLDGTRATLPNATAMVYTDGMSGEFTDYFATQCAGVYVKGATGMSEVNYGSTASTTFMGGNPHIIKLVKKTPNDDYDGGKYYLTRWKSSEDKFVLANNIESEDEEYAVYVTDGVAERVYIDENDDGIMSTAWGRNESRVYARFEKYSSLIYTNVDVSCETGNKTVEPCLERGDKLFVFDAHWGTKAPVGSTAA